MIRPRSSASNNVRTWVTNEVVTAAQLNQEIRDNLGCFAVMIAYTDGALLSGWTDYSATAGGRYIVATPTSGSTGGTVGTAMTNLQNKTHLHTGPSHSHTGAVHTHSDSGTTSGPNVYYDNTIQSGSGRSAAREDHTHTYSSTTGNPSAASTGTDGTGNTGNASTGDFAPFIQLLAMKKSA